MKISVCLASYNGESFIEQQLRSILSDLDVEDEIVLADDASSDRTLGIARSIGDARLKICSFDKNIGHVGNFERAISRATGKIIFLSDQDDIWVQGKRQQVVEAFERRSSLAMIVHALCLIDQHGRITAARSDVWPKSHAGVRSRPTYLLRQLIKNETTGCAVAFRNSMKDLILPFPKLTYAHDHWISVAAPFAGDILFLDEILLQYRRHGANITPTQGVSWPKKLVFRIRLSLLTLTAAWRAAGRLIAGTR